MSHVLVLFVCLFCDSFLCFTSLLLWPVSFSYVLNNVQLGTSIYRAATAPSTGYLNLPGSYCTQHRAPQSTRQLLHPAQGTLIYRAATAPSTGYLKSTEHLLHPAQGTLIYWVATAPSTGYLNLPGSYCTQHRVP